ncbi:MAG TPA: SCO family protein [Xanthobacteraceae bacterium]
MAARRTRVLLVLGAFAAGLAILLGVVLAVIGRGGAPILPQAAAVGGPFRLIDQDGRPISDEDLKGKPFLVFFGFTHCPDVCPTALFEVSEVLRRLGPDADRTAALFVTVDPERDTPDKLKDYLASFDRHLRGVTGDPAAVAALAKAYRAYYKKVPLEAGGYTMDHTALVYLMDKNGRFVAPFSLRRTPEEAAADLRRHL